MMLYDPKLLRRGRIMPAVIKPRVFVGSSSEARPVVQKLLAPLNAECAVAHPWWSSPAFNQDDTTFGALLAAAMTYDFGVFVIAADDLTTSRNSTKFTVRDNVLFELGLFIGQLGRERVAAILERLDVPNEIKMPSDLFGITMPAFKRGSSDILLSSIEEIAPKICERIRKAGLRHYVFSLRKSWDFSPSEHQFSIELDPVRIDRNSTLIGEKLLALVIRKRDPRKQLELDTAIVIGDIRGVSPLETEGVTLIAGTKECLGPLTAKDIVDGYLILSPEGVGENQIKQCKSLGELFVRGCRVVDTVGLDVGE
jgi:predicted nucleotide-binding protein